MKVFTKGLRALITILIPLIVFLLLYVRWSLSSFKEKIDVPSPWETLVNERIYFRREIINLSKQRNELSRLLNSARQTIGQMECSAKQHGEIANSGGWCSEDSGENSSQHMTDEKISKYLAHFFKGKSVGSFGDGPGLYKKYFDSTGLLKVYDAYDGAPYAPDVTNGTVKFLDLSVPQYGLPIYDWILSLEVAEHIPTKYQDIFLAYLHYFSCF